MAVLAPYTFGQQTASAWMYQNCVATLLGSGFVGKLEESISPNTFRLASSGVDSQRDQVDAALARALDTLRCSHPSAALYGAIEQSTLSFLGFMCVGFTQG